MFLPLASVKTIQYSNFKELYPYCFRESGRKAAEYCLWNGHFALCANAFLWVVNKNGFDYKELTAVENRERIAE